MTSILAKSKNVAAIDGLRAVAVISILLYHTDKTWLPGGFIGVDIFFVISGFVVALSVQSHKGDSFLSYVGWFYKRRIARIYPALLVFVLTGLLLWALVLPDGSSLFEIPLAGYSSLLGISNIFFFVSANDYFSLGAEYNIFTNTWSLGVEEQYYFLFPFISYALFVSPRLANRSRAITDGLVLALASVSLVICIRTSSSNYTFAFYMIFARFWEFAIGFVLANILVRPRGSGLLGRIDAPRVGVIATAIAALALAYAIVATRATAFPYPDAILPCLATGILLVAAFQGSGGWIATALAWPAVVWVGRVSYSLYLWHWLVIVCMRWTIGLDDLWVKIASIVGIFILSIFSYYFVERPIRYSKALLGASNLQFFSSVAVLLIFVAGIAGGLYWQRSVISFSATANEQIWRNNSIPVVQPGECRSARQRERFDGGMRYIFASQDCARKDESTLYVLGDSHAGAYQRDFYRLASAERTRVELYTAAGCRPLHLLQDDPMPASCAHFVEQAAGAILHTVRAGDTLFLPGLYIRRLRSSLDGPMLENAELNLAISPSDAEAAEKGYEFLRPFLDKGVRIVIEAPKPLLRHELLRCADPWTRNHPDCRADEPDRDYLLERRARSLAFLQAVADRSTAIQLWDPYFLLCPGKICNGYVDGKPVFFDTDHLSGYGNDVLYGSLRAALLSR